MCGGGGPAFAVQADVAKDADCRPAGRRGSRQFGRLDVLINNAAVTKTIPQRRMDLLDADEFERVFSVNLIGNYQMCRAAAPHLKATGDAAIVNISSIGALQGSRQLDRLFGLQGRAQYPDAFDGAALAPEVRVNALCPGGLLGNWTRRS